MTDDAAGRVQRRQRPSSTDHAEFANSARHSREAGEDMRANIRNISVQPPRRLEMRTFFSHSETHMVGRSCAVETLPDGCETKIGIWHSNTKSRQDKLTAEQLDTLRTTYVHGRGEGGMTVSAGYADHRNMSALLCRVGTKEPRDFEFLASCTGLDVAGINHAKASSWLDRAKKETDSLYEKQVAKTGLEQEYVVSGVLVSGPVRMVLHRAYERYSPRILGGAAA
ncbi:hypothetical protein ABZ438_16210 [Streptomyces sp. NPDC005786]|uniref:hypothetical protein n=1 Tax=Streptomyces sp. NPDC005786 TaxID=3154891 RepID=UPI0033D00B8D